jgi:hypothetical protein
MRVKHFAKKVSKKFNKEKALTEANAFIRREER